MPHNHKKSIGPELLREELRRKKHILAQGSDSPETPPTPVRIDFEEKQLQNYTRSPREKIEVQKQTRKTRASAHDGQKQIALCAAENDNTCLLPAQEEQALNSLSPPIKQRAETVVFKAPSHERSASHGVSKNIRKISDMPSVKKLTLILPEDFIGTPHKNRKK